MKILQVHNEYQHKGGEEFVLKREFDLLASGNHIEQFIHSNDDLKANKEKIRLFFYLFYNPEAKSRLHRVILKFQPDVVHIHNLFPRLTPSVLDACRDAKVPVVMTLHNFRLIDPGAMLIDAKGRIFEKTITGSAFSAIPRKSYRNSYLQTALVAAYVDYHRKIKDTWNNKVNRLIVLTDFARGKLVAGGISENLLVKKPNFINDHYAEITATESLPANNYFLYVGRLSREKGVKTLIETWNRYQLRSPLYIVGNGPLEDQLKQMNQSKNVFFLGQKKPSEVLRLQYHAKCMIIPSICYEGFPLSIVEAFSMGTPVICTNFGGQAEIVNAEKNGLHFKPNDSASLCSAVTLLNEKPEQVEELSRSARETYVNQYTPEINYKLLTSIYKQVITECKS